MPAEPASPQARPRPSPTPPARAVKSHPGGGGSHLHPAGRSTMPACRVGLLVAALLLGLLLLGFPPVTSEWGRRPEGRARSARTEPGGGVAFLLAGEMRILGVEVGRLMTKLFGSLVAKGGDPWSLGCGVQSAGGKETTED